jgi:hypothetical protein
MAETYTPAEIAARWKCSPDKVWAAIASKKLKAVNTCFRVNARRPRWIIRATDLECFEAARMTGAGAARPPRPCKTSGFNYF